MVQACKRGVAASGVMYSLFVDSSVLRKLIHVSREKLDVEEAPDVGVMLGWGVGRVFWREGVSR